MGAHGRTLPHIGAHGRTFARMKAPKTTLPAREFDMSSGAGVREHSEGAWREAEFPPGRPYHARP